MDIARELGFCEKKEVISPDEVLVITDVRATPKTVFPGGQVRLTVFLQNIDQEKDLPIEEGQQILAELYDYWIFKVDSTPAVPPIPPGGTRKVEWTLTAPSKEEIAGVKSEVDLKFRFIFPFEGRTTKELTVMTEKEYYAILDSGENFPIMGQTKTGGPVKVFAEIGTERPLIIGKSFPVYITVKNVGKGFVYNGVILPDELKITFPENIVVCDKMYEGDEFECEGCTCTNKKELRFFEDSTNRYSFNIKIKDSGEEIEKLVNGANPYLTKNIYVDFAYLYELRGEAKVTVQPYE